MSAISAYPCEEFPTRLQYSERQLRYHGGVTIFDVYKTQRNGLDSVAWPGICDRGCVRSGLRPPPTQRKSNLVHFSLKIWWHRFY